MIQESHPWACVCLVAQSCPTLCDPTRLFCPWGFSRQEYWSRLPCPHPGDLPNLGIKLGSPTLQVDVCTIWATREAPTQNYNSKRYMQHSSTIHKNQDMEATSMSIGRWMDRQHVVYIWWIYSMSNGISPNHKKEWNKAICSDMDGPRHYHPKQSKSEKDRCHMISLICGT